MITLRSICLCCCLAIALPATAYDGLRDDNPFVEAMLRMMELFGLIDRSRLPLSVPYMPGYSPALGGMTSMYGLGGLGGLSGLGGLGTLGALPGVGGLGGLSGLGGVPGMGAMPGSLLGPGAGMSQGAMGGWPSQGMPGLGGVPGLGGMPAYGVPGLGGQPWQQWPGPATAPAATLDGIWELNSGGVVVIRGDRARLYLSRERYQDFVIAYDRQQFSWAPLRGGSASRYRYQIRDGRMILQDKDGNYLLLRKRR